jgi:uncharacterized coiled-coil DUF342 family protein
MKTLTLALFILAVMSVSYAQDKDFDKKAGFRGKPPYQEMQHLRFAKYILSEKCIKTAEITPEQVERLKKEFAVLDQKMIEISKQIEEVSKKQAEVSVKVLTTPGDDGQEMMNMTDAIGRLRTEQAKLSVNVLMVIRDNLEPAQCASVVKQMKEQRDQMRSRQKTIHEHIQNRRNSIPDPVN